MTQGSAFIRFDTSLIERNDGVMLCGILLFHHGPTPDEAAAEQLSWTIDFSDPQTVELKLYPRESVFELLVPVYDRVADAIIEHANEARRRLGER